MDTLDIDRLEEIIKSLPDDRKNPMNDKDQCLYTGADGSHCIAGEILTIAGFDVPAYGTDRNTIGFSIMSDSFPLGRHVADVIDWMQHSADSASYNNYSRPWSVAKVAGLSAIAESREFDDRTLSDL